VEDRKLVKNETREALDDAADEEARWVEAARSGDDAAFTQLVERHRDGVYAIVIAITHDLDNAHDIAQEVFLRAWFGLRRLEANSSFAAWLRTIARNRCRTWLERRQRQPVQERIDLAELPDNAGSPMVELESQERRRLVEVTLQQLPEASREILVLHYIEGLPTPRIAAVLGISEAATRQRLRRARQHMREELEDMVADVIRDEAPGAEFTEEVSAIVARARGLFQQVQYREAVPALERARQLAPEDTLVSMLLADAYTFTRTPEELEAAPDAHARALDLLDEVLEREPNNLLARLRRAAMRAMLGEESDVLSDQKAILKDARGSQYESVARLELARRHLTRGNARDALKLYRELEGAYPWMVCVLHSEMGVAQAMGGKGGKAVQHFESAVELTTPEAMAVLQETSEQLLGQAYWAFWSTVDNLSVRQCQNHAWLAGLRSSSGDAEGARTHLVEAIRHLNHEEVGSARATLRREFVNQMEQMFPDVASQPEVQALREESDGP